jgi:hypothetical protein
MYILHWIKQQRRAAATAPKYTNSDLIKYLLDDLTANLDTVDKAF